MKLENIAHEVDLFAHFNMLTVEDSLAFVRITTLCDNFWDGEKVVENVIAELLSVDPPPLGWEGNRCFEDCD